MTNNNKNLLTLVTFLVVPLSGMCVDIYTPSLPAMVKLLSSTPAMIQLTVTLYTLGFAFGQILTGPITDAIGRKTPLLIGSTVHVFILVLICLSHSVSHIMVLRVLQGFCVALTSVPARAILSDLFSGAEFKKFANLMTMSWALGPILAPWIGGHLQHNFSWQANFIFLALYVALTLFVTLFFYRETLAQKKPFHPILAIENYATILTNRIFIANIVLLGSLAGLMILFNIIAPFLIQTILHYNAIVFGRCALLMGLACFLGNSLNRLLQSKVSEQTRCRYSLLLLLVTSIVMLLNIHFNGINLVSIVLPSFVLILLAYFLFPIFAGEALAMFPNNAGSANAVLFSGLWLCSTIITFIASRLHVRNAIPMTMVFVLLTLLSNIIYQFFCRRQSVN